ncbi:alpha/beta hydrolase [Pyxidicoccus xibeiensis]|uniref:alpha/beta hydrolase n=1 Tax=Pyxidicoccus xibeiensis TaxID=2906759 RepID=UPI0020A7F68F|nr:alpha/beta hydrolase [Pyxidicoccus xibeiensis]MCP3135754.1 alpha/beta fold hydrolase [Pyxidicoccus xibeiensis]
MGVRPFFINIAPDGTFAATSDYATTPGDVDALFAALNGDAQRRLLLYFHGGLVAEASGIRVARAMTEHFGETSYAVSFVWNSGLLDVIRASIRDISNTKLFQKLVRVVMKRVSGKLSIDVEGRGGTAGLTDADIDAIIRGAKTSSTFDDGARGSAPEVVAQTGEPILRAELQGELDAELSGQDPAEWEEALQEAQQKLPEDLLNDELRQPMDTEGQRGVVLTVLLKLTVGVAFRVIKRYVGARDHGFYPTVFEEVLRQVFLAKVGEWAWGRMKRSAQLMWANPAVTFPKASEGAGLTLLRKLSAMDPKPRIDVIGHSAGSIAICHMFEALDREKLDLKVRNVVLLAPACRHDLFRNTIIRHQDRWKSFRMFTMLDELEAADALVDDVPFLYPRSLLYLVSGAFEAEADTPLLGMTRFLKGQKPFDGHAFDDVKAFMDEPGRLVLAKTGDDATLGLRCHAADHGTFDEDVMTMESLKHLAQ